MLWSCVIYVLLLGTVIIPNVCAQSEPNATELTQRALRALFSLEQWYDGDSGLWETTGWWNGEPVQQSEIDARTDSVLH